MNDWLTAAAASSPDHEFVIEQGTSFSYGETADRVAGTAARLRAAGVVDSAVVGLWAANTFETILEMLALWRVGATVQLVNTRLTVDEINAQLSETKAHMLVGSGAPDVAVPRVSVGTTPASGGVEASEIRGDRVAWIVFTSGSSGRPKGVRLTFDNLEASARASAQHLGHDADDRWLCDLPLFHVGGASIVVRSMRQRGAMLLEPRFDPVRAAALLRAGDATLASMVAATLTRTLDVHPRMYTGVRAVLVGGGPVPFDLLERARAGGMPVLPTYGMTETASQVATGRLSDGKVIAVPGAELRTVAGGRIEVRGPMVFRGYVGEPDRDPSSWFQTGDLGAVHDDGVVEVFGRADDVIVSGGENVHPAEVEAVLEEHDGVEEVVVLGVPDDRWGSSVVAVYTGDAAPGELERHARYRLAGYKIPRRWIKVGDLPRLPLGKVDRKALREIV